ncbi:MAG: flagellar biosynthesis anti-sigma factor FlgM [Planctomycetes bacterium]|nr:flagellar biosynthesis anti-sigma factor FlgM [Planctomycetota bacterium]MCC8117058.1 flagellar biosynthesis anti-sigma factor FlgM [Planctomycetota bacterium]
MKISGYGEFQQMRKASQKDDAHLKETAERAEADSESADAVTISPEARRKGKLRMASDYRESRVADVKARLEAGTLVTDESLKSGTRKMLGALFAGEL